MYRKIGFRDVFMVMGARKGTWVTFNSKGKAEQWDPWTGNNLPLEAKDTDQGTMVKMPLDSTEAQLIVFTPSEENQPVILSKNSSQSEISENLLPVILEDSWEFELKPTMNNSWGDFRLPLTENIIGAEARIFRYSDEKGNSKGWELPGFDDSKWQHVTYGFGQKFWKLGPLPDSFDNEKLEKELSRLVKIDPQVPVDINGRSYYWTPYSFSWRLGLEGDPGHQGYHGLKEEVTDEFICLGKPVQGLNETLYKKEDYGSTYFLWTSAYCENVTNVTIDAAGLLPSSVYINGRKTEISPGDITLNKGSNPLLLRYKDAGRGYFVLVDGKSRSEIPATPLSMKWWDLKEKIPFDVHPSERTPAGWYRFTAPPGLKSLNIRSNGKIRIWIDGKEAEVKSNDAMYKSQIVALNKTVPEKSIVALRIEQIRGDYGGSSLPEPVLISCGKGLTETGDWSMGSILENYSGGAWYRKKVILSGKQAGAGAILDLGKVVATAEVHVNGSLAGILVTSPWRIDISKFIIQGENKIEILVYNTLANHYLTIPTRYRGNSLQSGLLGPVKLEFKSVR
jgi:hypothetical protein